MDSERQDIVQMLVNRGKEVLDKTGSISVLQERLESTRSPTKKLTDMIVAESKALFKAGRQSVLDEIARQKQQAQNTAITDDAGGGLEVNPAYSGKQDSQGGRNC